MIEINENIFKIAYSEFNKIVNENSNEKILDFKNHPFIDKSENYKYAVLVEAKNQLLTKTWKENEIGSGRILECVKNSIQTSVIHNFRKEDNNLIDWRKKDDFNKLKANNINEKMLFNFFKSKIKDEIAFGKFNEIGFSYQLIAYLFFIKNSQKYLPISQERFDEIFNSLGINFKTSHNCSWENYIEYNEIVKQFKNQLSQKFQNITLLDTHTFLWIYGYQFEKLTEKSKPKKATPKTEQKTKEIPKEKPKPKLEIYQPKKVVDIDNLTETKSEIDYIENHRKLMEIGELAEKIVLKNEIEFLEPDFPDLAKQVRLVSNNPKLGFDILSFETDGKQKQIEVKAISENKNKKSFIITRNEFSKSKTYSNYYIFCVTEINSHRPKILRIKNPDFDKSDKFAIEPLTYKITFE